MAIKQPTTLQRVKNWAGDRVAQMIWAGRMRHQPARDTTPYAKLMSLGGQQYSNNRSLPKPTPANLRRFSRTVYARRAINRVKNSVAALKWEVGVKAGVKENAELRRQIEQVTMCLAKPNSDDSFRTLLEQVVEDMLVCGAGCIEQEIGGQALRPLWMWPVDALSIEIYPAWSGGKNEPRYAQTMGYGNAGGVHGIPLLNDQLIYIRKDPSTDNPFGVGCLEVAFASINRLLGTAAFAGNVAGNSQPANLLWFKGMDSNTLDRFREWWRNEVEGQGITPLIGGDDAKALPLRGTTDDALYLKYQEFLIREIATAFEISPGNLGVEADVNRSTAEVAEERDWSGAIAPTATNVAAHINREAIEGRLGYSQIEFRFLGIDREDEELLSKIHETYYGTNVLTPNEIRERMGLKPSKSEWADLCHADVEIAQIAAKGVGQNLDADLKAPSDPGRQIKDPDERGMRGRSKQTTPAHVNKSN